MSKLEKACLLIFWKRKLVCRKIFSTFGMLFKFEVLCLLLIFKKKQHKIKVSDFLRSYTTFSSKYSPYLSIMLTLIIESIRQKHMETIKEDFTQSHISTLSFPVLWHLFIVHTNSYILRRTQQSRD